MVIPLVRAMFHGFSPDKNTSCGWLPDAACWFTPWKPPPAAGRSASVLWWCSLEIGSTKGGSGAQIMTRWSYIVGFSIWFNHCWICIVWFHNQKMGFAGIWTGIYIGYRDTIANIDQTWDDANTSSFVMAGHSTTGAFINCADPLKNIRKHMENIWKH